MKSLRFRAIAILLITLGALYYISPTFIYFSLPKEKRNDPAELEKAIPTWLPKKHIKLGLDLQGGVQLVLGVDTEAAIDNRLSRIGTEVERWANEDKPKVKEAYAIKGQQTLRIVLEDGVDPNEFRASLREQYTGLERVGGEGQTLDLKYDDNELKRIRDGSLEQAEKVVRSRIDKWGVSEPSINRRADKSIMVQLPGFKDPDKAKELLGRTAQLKFKLVDEEFRGFSALEGKLPPGVTLERRGNSGAMAIVGEDKQQLIQLAQPLVPEGRELLFEETVLAGGKKVRYTGQVLKAATELSGEDVLDASVTYDPNSLTNDPVVSMKFTPTGGKRFADITGGNIGRRMAIVLDDVIVSDPVIQSKISGGSAQITLGSGEAFNVKQEQANQLALILRSGALPAPITILEERQVGATLGPELANQGVMSVLVGLVFVLVFITGYYRIPGALSCLALVLNGILLLMLMAAFGFSLTLPGFAGFILTLGMAVDANVLINERIIDELRDGRPPQKAVDNAFTKVFWTIIDANVTTLVAAFVMLETSSSGPVKGFAISLILGLLVSLFTALTVTHTFFKILIGRAKSEQQIKNWLGWARAQKQAQAPRRQVDFMKYGKAVTGFGIALVLAVLVGSQTLGFNWAVDFTGGTQIDVVFGKPVEGKVVREALTAAGVEDVQLQEVGNDKTQWSARFEGSNITAADGAGDSTAAATAAANTEQARTMRQTLMTKLADYQPDVQRVEYVGPAIGKELRQQGIYSVFWAVLGIVLYVALRFDSRFVPGAILKMVFDVSAVLVFYIFFQRAFDLTAVAGVLTVIGYSVNDVIVIYDRIRENIQGHARRSLLENVNISLNETLSRSINTSITTMVSLLGILVFGTSNILNFAIAMVIGIVAATISSTFVATTGILFFEQWKKNRPIKVTASASNEAARG
ncbi:protein translocase subunit SecD [Oligoflexus tunisiensis]|uniref:protein translocase subunit SecD n=1 Tax=Oligoflexus tunisiensis TaxID=708132 RepID=UPI000A6B0E3E|nr:protein translocase subunit SecD [Oligoflexus tunisiensis]